MIAGFVTGGQFLIWLTLMVIGALLWEINKKLNKKSKEGKK